MASANHAREYSIERTDEYEEFINRLAEFHKNRGTNFEREPKVGNRRVDYLRFYRRIVDEGGYDHVSDTRASPLAWRRIGQELGFGDGNMATLAFTLKTVYYKNLAAFEIMDIHKKEPPPKEILEDISAKGGNLLNRTLESFPRPLGRDLKSSGSGDADDLEGEAQQGTPRGDSMDIDELSGAGFRSSRGLRQAPPQRQLFQSDVTLYRPTRQPSGQAQSPGSQSSPFPPQLPVNGVYGGQTAAQALANYEPKPSIPLTLRPMTTPGNNPDLFRVQQAQIKDAALARINNGVYAARNVPMLPGTGFSGPNVYIRTFMGLKSGVLEEQEYALHHLVKISHERGDKYRFDNFSGLIEALIDKLLETSKLFYDANWKVSYDNDVDEGDFETLDGLNGTPDILDRIKRCEPIMWTDQVQPDEVTRNLRLINEAGLVLRNMSMLQENAEYLSRYPSVRDTLTIILNLPQESIIAELRQYCHETAEQVTRFMTPSAEDPLISTLIDATQSKDRGIIISSLRALSRVGTQAKTTAFMAPLPTAAVLQVNEWLLVEDQDLRAACLDLLYRFTALLDNLEELLRHTDIHALVRQLVRLLQFGSRTDEWQDIRPAPKPIPPRTPVEDSQVPQIPPELVEQLLGYDEPERSSQWLRTCFEEDPSGEITQIALWQAYQFPFTPFSAQRPLLPAKDFITNVSHTFHNASAQVQGNNPPRFVIKGIRPRAAPVDPRGRTYMRCHWILEDGNKCPEFAAAPKQMWEHIISTHLQVIKDSDGQYDFTPLDDKAFKCRWQGCQKFDKTSAKGSTSFAIGMHVKTHLPDSSNMAYQRSKHNISAEASDVDETGSTRSWTTHNTMTDERQDATGLPLMAALVLRNLARNIPRTSLAGEKGRDDLLRSVFAPVKRQLYYILAYNRSLGEYLSNLTRIIDALDA